MVDEEEDAGEAEWNRSRRSPAIAVSRSRNTAHSIVIASISRNSSSDREKCRRVVYSLCRKRARVNVSES